MFKKRTDLPELPGQVNMYKPETKILLTTRLFRFIKKGEVYGVQNIRTNSLGEVYYEDSSLSRSYDQQGDENTQVVALLRYIDCERRK